MIPLTFWTYRVGVVHPPRERNFFVISEAAQWTKFHQAHFQVKTTLPSSFCQCSNNSFWIGIRFYRPIFFGILSNFLISLVRDTVKPWNVWRYVSLIKEVDWWRHFHFLMTNSKICIWSVSYTPVMLHNQWHY